MLIQELIFCCGLIWIFPGFSKEELLFYAILGGSAGRAGRISFYLAESFSWGLN
jgi:hypothetical protein